MDTALIFAETIFYFTVSLAIITIGTLCAIIAYHLVRITRELGDLSHDLNNVTSDITDKINEIINRLSNLPILSFFLRKGSKKHTKKHWSK